eukprot:TRINITY_DN11_c0_g1_i1.p1 TRINITY_DN11_c0_g1~~TRINITY_DN11_c0_g1_i1.p1  ORF type:complete len:129 (+),score=4.10 TRINITY_DN11_c0_g1_i1:77-463(+)
MSDFEKSVCGCFGDPGACFLTCFCPCVQFGQNMEMIGESCVLWGCLPIILILLNGVIPFAGIFICCVCCVGRGKVREKYGIDGNAFFDWCWICGCDILVSCLVGWPCGLWLTVCQEANEIKYRNGGGA